MRQVKSKYVVFIDNDVHVALGWLEPLVQCAEETEATVVCPLVCIGQPLHNRVRLAGGEARIVLEVQEENFRRRVREKRYFVNCHVSEVREQLQRRRCEFAKFHCLLVRREIFESIGILDEKLFNTKESTDFCLSVTQAGGTIYCEPESVVTYVPGPPFERSDIFFFRLRWNDNLELASLRHFRQKWNLAEDQYFEQRYRRLGQRRQQAFLRPLVHRLSLGQPNPKLEKMLVPAERMVNYYITNPYIARMQRVMGIGGSTSSIAAP